ncbi:MAG: glycosyltransferase family 4 protein [Phocaeicola sp.]
MKKILIFHHYNSAIGAGLCLLHIVASIKDDYQVSVVLPAGGDLPEKLRALHIGVYETAKDPVAYQHYNGSTTRAFSLRHWKNIRAIECSKGRIIQYIEDFQPDIVAVNSMTLFWIGKIAHDRGIRTVCFHRETFKHGLLGLRTRYIKQHIKDDFDAVAYISDYDRIEAGETNRIAVRITDKVELSKYDSAEDKTYWRQKLGLPLDKKLILYCGGCSRLKGGLTAVSAMKYVKNKLTNLVFLQYQKAPAVTTTKQKLRNILKRMLHKDYQYLVEREISQADLMDRVILCPATDCVEQYFLACDAVVFPSHLAHQARPIYEAGAARIPIFLSDFPNTREFATEENAYLCKPDDPKALADRINEWIDNPDQVIARVKRNEQMTRENHDLRQLRDQVISLLG